MLSIEKTFEKRFSCELIDFKLNIFINGLVAAYIRVSFSLRADIEVGLVIFRRSLLMLAAGIRSKALQTVSNENDF